MRILHVNKFVYRRGGAESYMEDVADLQRRAGHQVELFGMQHPANPRLALERHFPGQVELDPPPQGLLGRARSVGQMLYSPAARRGMAAAVDEFRPDVVHLHNIYHQLTPSVLGPLRKRHIPSVLTLHDYKLACPTYLMLDKGAVCDACIDGGFRQAVRRRCRDGSLLASGTMALESTVQRARHAYDPVQLFLCPSRFMRSKMLEAGVYPDRLRHCPLPVDVAGLEPKRTSGGSLVYAGRLSMEKGVDVLVEAMAFAPGGAHLEIAGDGPERAHLEARAHVVAPGRVHFHGRVTREAVRALISGAGAVVVPSRCFENQPLLVLEAHSLGVVVVGSDLGGIAELVEPGVTGLLVPADDPRALGEALGVVLGDPGGASRMGRAGRAAVQVDHDPDLHVAALERLYGEASSIVERQRSATVR